MMIGILPLTALAALVSSSHAFVVPSGHVASNGLRTFKPWGVILQESSAEESKSSSDTGTVVDAEVEEKVVYGPKQQKKIQDLIRDDEWVEFSIVVAESVRQVILDAVEKFKTSGAKDLAAEALQDIDTRAREIAVDVDARVKSEVARLRGKEEYEFGDLTKALVEFAKEKVCEVTGKEEYEFGDLSVEIDKRIKAQAAAFCGKENFDLDDFVNEVEKRADERLEAFKTLGLRRISKVKKEIEKEREEWATSFLDDQAMEDVKDLQGKIDRFTETSGIKDAVKNIFGGLFGN